MRAEFSELIAKKLSDYCLKLLETFKSSRKTWNVINNLRNTKSENSRMSALMNSFGDLITEDKKIANQLNYTFSHLGDYYGRNLPNKIESTTTPNLFSFRPTTIKEVFDAVKSLEINKPLGPCSIPAWAIKDGMTEIVPHLTMVINEYIKEQQISPILKKGLITPLYKKDDPLNPLNYRPITITSSLSKIFEKFLHKKINQYLSSNKLLSSLQFGFREKISTQIFIPANRSVNMLTKAILFI